MQTDKNILLAVSSIISPLFYQKFVEGFLIFYEIYDKKLYQKLISDALDNEKYKVNFDFLAQIIHRHFYQQYRYWQKCQWNNNSQRELANNRFPSKIL